MFFRKFINHINEKTDIFMNKPVYLGLSILKISKIAKYDIITYGIIT